MNLAGQANQARPRPEFSKRDATETRAQVAWVRAVHHNQLDYSAERKFRPLSQIIVHAVTVAIRKRELGCANEPGYAETRFLAKSYAIRTRARVAWARAEYHNQLDYNGDNI